MLLPYFSVLCCTNTKVGKSKIYIQQETINYNVFIATTLKDTPKMIDNYEVGSVYRVKTHLGGEG